MKKVICLILFIVCAFSALAEDLHIDPENIKAQMSDTLYGLFFEDINCAADGGLYPELVLNRSFEYENILDPKSYDHYTGWRVMPSNDSKGEWNLESSDPIHENNETYLSVNVLSGSVKCINQGFNGSAMRGDIKVESQKEYDLSIYAKSQTFKGEITVAITDAGGNPISDIMTVVPGENWEKYEKTVTAQKDANGFLTVTLSGEGRADIDMISLMPYDRFGKEWPGGGVRTDIYQALKDLNPAFLRFPGGCVAEGSYVRSNFYNWKDTVGAVETRKENGNTWGGMQTYGIGFYEYFMMCEDMGALPVPVVHAGVLCQARDVMDPIYSLDETRAYAEDILDLIEFALGDKDTEWGSVRSKMGHPEPFDLRYIAIGNENWGTQYFTRYAILERIVKEQYPDITTIVAAGPVAEGGLINDSWNRIRKDFSDSLVDEHYYMDSGWFLKNVNRYDRYLRTTKVFLGEFAAHEPVQGTRRPNNLYAALCEAAYLTGIERNSDVVEMCCYAPLLARDGMVDWTPNLIWFNEKEVLLTPSYHVQKMFSETLGDYVIDTTLNMENVYHVVTKTESEIQIKIVNVDETAKEVVFSIDGVDEAVGKTCVLAGEKTHANSFVKPQKVAPGYTETVFKDGKCFFTLEPMSLSIIVVPLK